MWKCTKMKDPAWDVKHQLCVDRRPRIRSPNPNHMLKLKPSNPSQAEPKSRGSRGKAEMQVQAQCIVKSGPTISFGKPTQRWPINPTVGPYLGAHGQCRRIPYTATVRQHPWNSATRTTTTTINTHTIIITKIITRCSCENAAMGHVEGRWSAWNVDPGRLSSATREDDWARRSEEVRRRSESGDDGVADVSNGGVSSGL